MKQDGNRFPHELKNIKSTRNLRPCFLALSGILITMVTNAQCVVCSVRCPFIQNAPVVAQPLAWC